MSHVFREIGNVDISPGYLGAQLEENYILDPEDTHHEFKGGMHGRKMDFGLIEPGSTLYNLWVGVTANYIKENYEEIPPAIIGVANGANPLVEGLKPILGDDMKAALTTEKFPKQDEIRMTRLGRFILEKVKPKWVLIGDDMGTMGTNVSKVVENLRSKGGYKGRIEALYTWQRRPTLERLDEIGVPYRAIIETELPTFTPEECQNDPQGFCHRGIELIQYGQEKASRELEPQ